MSAVNVTSTVGQPYRQVIKSGNYTFYADVQSNNGGGGTAPDPHQLLLGSLGACTSMTLQMYASRKGWDLKQVSVDLKEEKASGQTKITKAIQVRGNLDPQQLSMLKTVAEKCPINKILLSDIQMESTLNLIA